MWTGFAQTKKKYGIIFKVSSDKISKDNILHMKVSGSGDNSVKKYKTCIEQFIGILML